MSHDDIILADYQLHPDVTIMLARLERLIDTGAYEVELQAVANAVPKRRREFIAGRNLARTALTKLGITAGPIPRNQDRTPAWPVGVRGSISHTDKHVAVALTTSSGLLGVGIDIEPAGGVDSELRDIIVADGKESTMDDTQLFSAKEAIFKALFPICGEFLEFKDVSVVLAESDGSFTATTDGRLASAEVLRKGSGKILTTCGLVIAVFWISA